MYFLHGQFYWKNFKNHLFLLHKPGYFILFYGVNNQQIIFLDIKMN